MASGPRITSRELNAVLPGGFGGAVGGFGLFPKFFKSNQPADTVIQVSR